MNTFVENWLDNSPERKRLYAQEGLILEVTEEIWDAMDRQHKSKADLARDLNSSKANVSQLLNGSRNMTLRTLSDIAETLGQKVHVRLEDKSSEGEWQTVSAVRVHATPSRRWNPAAIICANDSWSNPTPLRLVAPQ